MMLLRSLGELPPACDLAVVGAGPAGLAAAAAAAGQGLQVLLVDENPEPGGQI
jgi:sarcosine oxidase subunit alpha